MDDNRHSWNIIPGVLVAIEKEGNSSARRMKRDYSLVSWLVNIRVDIEQACRNPSVDADFHYLRDEKGGELHRQQVGLLPIPASRTQSALRFRGFLGVLRGHNSARWEYQKKGDK
jgi:hypothetical protein